MKRVPIPRDVQIQLIETVEQRTSGYVASWTHVPEVAAEMSGKSASASEPPKPKRVAAT